MKLFEDCSDSVFWLTFWAMGFLTVFAVIVLIVIYAIIEDINLRKNIEAGADTKDLICIYETASFTTVCDIRLGNVSTFANDVEKFASDKK